MTRLDRAELTAVVAKLMAGDYPDADELDRDADRLRNGVRHPEVLGLIFHPERYFEHQPTVADVLDRALNYRAVEL